MQEKCYGNNNDLLTDGYCPEKKKQQQKQKQKTFYSTVFYFRPFYIKNIEVIGEEKSLGEEEVTGFKSARKFYVLPLQNMLLMTK